MGLGVLLALIAALFSSLKGITRKHVAKDFTSVEIGYLGQVYGVILLLPFAAWRYTEAGITLGTGVIAALMASTLIIVFSTYLYIEVLRITDISIAEPLRNISPIFVALLEPLILGIDFRTVLLAAALLASAGTYILVSKDSLLKPVENLMDKGAALSILVALLLALYSIAQRFGATHTDPLLFVYLAYLTSLMGFWILRKRESAGNIEPESYFRKDIFVLGTVTASGVVAGIFAYSMITASEVTVIKQSSAIFGVLIGGRFFREERLGKKLLGAAIIALGVLLVAI